MAGFNSKIISQQWYDSDQFPIKQAKASRDGIDEYGDGSTLFEQNSEFDIENSN